MTTNNAPNPAVAAAAAATVADLTPGADEVVDYSALVEADKAPASDSKADKKEETPAPKAVEEKEEAAVEQQQAEPTAAEKALAKLTADMEKAAQTIAALQEKIESGAKLSAAEQQQAQQAARKIETVRKAIKEKGKDFDPLDHGLDLAESLLETDDTVQKQAKRIESLEARLEKAEKAGQQSAVESHWDAAAKAYPGVNVQEVWEKAKADAAADIGADNPALANLANKYFQTRAGAAAKNKANKDAPAIDPKAATAQQRITTGGTRVQAQAAPSPSPSAEVSEDTKYLQDAVALVV